MLPNELVYGSYELHEVQSAEGYVLDGEPTPFTISGTVDTVVVEKFNAPQKGRISITKTGDSFVSVMTEEGKYTPVFEETGLSGAVYQITAAEDIITPDGTVRANAGDFITELITDENGYAETDLLYLGKYDIEEIEAPFGYVLNDEIQTIELVYAGQDVAVRDTVNTSFVNDHQGVKISLSKVMENDEKFEIYGEEYAVNVRFGLFAAEEITAADGSTIPENGLIAEVSLGEDMSAVIAEKLPFSRYYVQEIATDEKYILNGEKYLVSFEYMGQEMTTVDIDCGTFTYLAGEDVIPKDSLCYHKFTVLNEINNIQINGEKISVELKQKIYNELFMKFKKVTRKKLEDFLRSEGCLNDNAKLSGIDIQIKSDLKPQLDFKRLLDSKTLNEADVEAIILRITASDSKKRIKSWLTANYPKLESDDIKYILNQTVSIDGTRQTVLNAARIYSHSVFEALNDEDVSKIKFMQLL